MIKRGKEYIHAESFDQQGNESESIIYSPKGTILGKAQLVNIYDSEGRLVEVNTGPSSKATVYKYDSKNNVIEKDDLLEDRSISSKERYVYDPDGNLSEQSGEGGMPIRIVFKYSQTGKLIERDRYLSRDQKLSVHSIWG